MYRKKIGADAWQAWIDDWVKEWIWSQPVRIRSIRNWVERWREVDEADAAIANSREFNASFTSKSQAQFTRYSTAFFWSVDAVYGIRRRKKQTAQVIFVFALVFLDFKNYTATITVLRWWRVEKRNLYAFWHEKRRQILQIVPIPFGRSGASGWR